MYNIRGQQEEKFLLSAPSKKFTPVSCCLWPSISNDSRFYKVHFYLQKSNFTMLLPKDQCDVWNPVIDISATLAAHTESK